MVSPALAQGPTPSDLLLPDESQLSPIVSPFGDKPPADT